MTSIDLYSKFVSFTPYSYKIGLIKTIIHCSYEIRSFWTSFNEEISNVKHLLMRNMNSSYLIDKQIKRFKELCKKFCKNSNINIVFSPFKTGDLFSSKDCLPSGLKSFILYKFVCAGCQSCYIRENKRHLPMTINEHLVPDKKSHIFKHLLENPA